MNSFPGAAKLSAPASQPSQVLDQLRQRVRLFHYSAQTEQAYLRWVRAYMRWQQQQVCDAGGWQLHESGRKEVNAFLAALAARKGMSPAMHRQALHALLFLYRHVLGRDLLVP